VKELLIIIPSLSLGSKVVLGSTLAIKNLVS